MSSCPQPPVTSALCRLFSPRRSTTSFFRKRTATLISALSFLRPPAPRFLVDLAFSKFLRNIASRPIFLATQILEISIRDFKFFPYRGSARPAWNQWCAPPLLQLMPDVVSCIAHVAYSGCTSWHLAAVSIDRSKGSFFSCWQMLHSFHAVVGRATKR
jgi:hypothetical protein